MDWSLRDTTSWVVLIDLLIFLSTSCIFGIANTGRGVPQTSVHTKLTCSMLDYLLCIALLSSISVWNDGLKSIYIYIFLVEVSLFQFILKTIVESFDLLIGNFSHCNVDANMLMNLQYGRWGAVPANPGPCWWCFHRARGGMHHEGDLCGSAAPPPTQHSS